MAVAEDGPREGIPFKPRFPWWGSHLQTVRNSLLRVDPALPDGPGERLAVAARDGSGDRLLARLHRPAADAGRPVVAIVHGLTGCEDSRYVRATAASALARGYPALRVNLRGAGPSRRTCAAHYHAGRSEDLADVLGALPGDVAAGGIVLVGYSLGGSLVAKCLGEQGDVLPVRAAAIVSTPIDLAAAAERMVQPRNAPYHAWLLRRMKAELLGTGAAVSEAERRAARWARNVIELDERFIAPRAGYRSGADYYAACSATRFLPDVAVPTLVVHALDDPWIPAAAYRDFPWQRNPALRPLVVARGGHVGFHGRGARETWHDRQLMRFFQDILE